MGACGSKEPKTKDGGCYDKPIPSMHGLQKEEAHPDKALMHTHELIKFLGRGGTGDTYLFRDKRDGQLVAIKLIKRPIPKVIMPNILREIRIQAELGEGHINVINAKEAILTDAHLGLAMEYAAGASLTSYVAERWQHAQHTGLFLTEDEARYFFRQFVAAVEFCHQHCVAHRDLKLDNTLLDDSQPPVIKLCDFGFAKTWTEDANMYTHIGTPVYMSPELINSRNGARGYDGKSVDVWASGVLLIVMLLGTFPFDHTEHPDPNTSEAHLEVWLQQVRSRWNEIPHIRAAVEKLSPECMDLLNRIFVIDDKKRITVEGIKEHPWYQKPLLTKYKAAEEGLISQQAVIADKFEKRRLDLRLLKARNEQLQHMIEQAGTRPQGLPASAGPLMRVDLSDQVVLEEGTIAAAAPELAGMGTIGEATEDEEAPMAPAQTAVAAAPPAANGIAAAPLAA